MIYRWLCLLVLAHIALTWIRAIQRGLDARKRNSPNWANKISQPPVSILVPAWNESGTIERCIQSLQAINYPEWEALILAGGSDGTLEAAQQVASEDSRFRVLRRGPEPKNVAISQGIEVAKHSIIVILDADSIVESTWLRELVKPITDGAAASFGMHYPARETWVSMAEQMGFIFAYYSLGSKLGAGCSSLAIGSEVLERLGPLPATAYSWEDWDIDVKLIDAGERIEFAPQARLVTDRPSTLRDYWTAILRSYRSHWAGMWFHREKFLRRPLWGLKEIFFQVYGPFVSLGVIASLLIAIALPSSLPMVSKGLALFALWTLGRRAALSPEVFACTGESKWLVWTWASLLILPFQFAAALVAVLTVWQQPSYDYKGPRLTQYP